MGRVKIGIVVDVNSDTRRARVKYPDNDRLISGWLYVLYTGANWMPRINDPVLIIYMDGFNADGYILGSTHAPVQEPEEQEEPEPESEPEPEQAR